MDQLARRTDPLAQRRLTRTAAASPDVEDAEKLEFGEFLQAVATYCSFAEDEILKCNVAGAGCAPAAVVWLTCRGNDALSLLFYF